MDKEKIDAAISKTNSELKAARCRCRVYRRHDRLVLRGTLPPRPDSLKSKPHTQWLSIGTVGATPAGFRKARKTALEVSEQLNEGIFNWTNWLEDQESVLTIKDWIAAFERSYFEERGKTPKTETTWGKDYRIPYGRLPQDELLTAEALQAGVMLTKTNTRSRQRYCMAYSALARFAGIDIDLKPLKGKYSSKAVSPRSLPSDELILEWEKKIPDLQWQSFYRLMVIYGIRNHECWYIDLQRLTLDPIVQTDGKTNKRFIVPFPVSWWEMWFSGQVISLPKLTARKNSDYGRLSAQYFKRLGLPFHLYDLRHAHAVRMAAAGVDGQLAAKIQGHSSKVHEQIYLNFMNEEHFRKMLEQFRQAEG